MATRRTVDLLPEIFRTQTNKQFLGATLDQLTQEAVIKRTQGYVGRRVGPGVNPADNYVVEPTATRSDYQLEPGVVFLKPETNTVEDVITYPGIIDALNLKGADTTRQDALFQSQYYTWDPFCDLDKFTNYSQYYWLPQGPDSVDVFGTPIALTDAWDITRGETAYTFSDLAGANPTLTLVRGGNYEFNVNQPGFNFWIQAAPGVNGTMPATPNISSRDVLGVVNNGESQGTVTFNVPLKTAQDFYYTLTNIGTVDLLTGLKFNQLNNVYVSEFLAQYPDGIDGITNLNGRTVIFTNTTADAEAGGWQVTTQFDPLPRDNADNGLVGSFDTTTFDQTTNIDSQAQRYSIWQIQYVNDLSGNPFMQLTSIQTIPNFSKFVINFGTDYASTQWYKDAEGYFQQVPLLTAVLDDLFYQDSVNPALYGRIKLVDPGDELFINLDDIIGAKNYTSPNGVVFTNGLKVQFRGFVEPARFQNLEYYVEGVGTGPGVDVRVGFVDGEAYFGAAHIYQGQLMTGAVHSTATFQQYIYETVEESILNTGAGAPAGAALPNTPVSGVNIGNGIKLLPVSDFVTPETYTRSATVPYDSTSYDSEPYDSSLNAPTVPDYITINRASRDLNAWTRSNRWFHIDVIRATATYNNQDQVIDNRKRAKRPIIEFRANINLYNFGTQGKQPVNVVDFRETDALSNINGQRGYGIDGYTFINGSRVIFAADLDSAVRNKIYEVQFIDPDNSGTLIIDLIEVPNGTALVNQTVVSLSGNTLQGKSFWFDGVNWLPAQEKLNVNQPPLFDVFDDNGISFSNLVVYPSTTFRGSQLFGYASGSTQIIDEFLGFALRYLNINNVGDIVFENYLYTDTFIYVRNNVSSELAISTGFVRQYVDRVTFGNLIGWQTAAAENRSRQVFSFVYDQLPLVLDIAIDTETVYTPIQLFVEGVFLDPTNYTYTVSADSTTITLNDSLANGAIIEAQVLSNQTSSVGFYQIPLNLENNPLNENSNTFTLGTIRTHYESIGQNLKDIQGPIVGANNSRDLGDIITYGDVIVQHSSPLALTGVFLRRQQFELFNSLEFNSREYAKFKALLLDLTVNGDFENLTATQVLDAVLQEISLGRSEISPFYWSDMITAGETYTENTYTYSFISTPTFDTIQTYNFTESNYQGLSVFLNGTLLTRGYDYDVVPDAPSLVITTALAVGDIIKIREYPTTYGSYVPNTPTKIGLYPAFRPAIYIDTTYIDPRAVIRGHDGSITLAFNDVRDQVLLEFEKRIFNNLKIVSAIPLIAEDVVPGQFRTTEYTLNQVNDILSTDFLTWVGWNKLDYSEQNYIAGNEFTYNYSQSSNVLTTQPAQAGAWRGLYNYFYDTYTPDSTPWQMLGLSEQPDWWEAEYGAAPYTSGNTVLWDDLAAGLIKEPGNYHIDPRFVRPELLQVLPVDSEGQLVSPLYSVIGNYDATSFRRSWIFGDDGPVENAWRTSSAWPFAVMRLLALTKPAEFFSLLSDRDRYVFNTPLSQYLWDGRYRLDAKKLTPLYGNGNSKASYLNWIIDYNRQLGINSTTNLTLALDNIDIRLCWRMAAFSDKNYLKVYTERSTPSSLNTSLLLPDESYQLLLYKNQPFNEIAYSSVIIQKVEDGYTVLGYSTRDPYFEILVSRPSGRYSTVVIGTDEVRVSLEHTNNVVKVPYGFTFTNIGGVCDFLVSYGKLLENQGLLFADRENGYVLDWLQMAQEFVYWTQQGWAVGTIINLNPAATSISVDQPFSVVDSIKTYNPEDIILNQNRQPLPIGNMVIERLNNFFKVTSLTSDTINFANLKFTAYEHIMVLDNRSIFADLIYQPVTGARQNRILVSGNLSGDWNGTVNAPGFVLNQDNILQWQSNTKYAKGEIVLFKNEYWSASTIIQPSQEFNYNLWIKSDYGAIQKGLLPNAANSSDQLATAYSVFDANLESEVDLFSYGLIGFRPREYMQALNLDDVSQVNLYQQFLGSKGTVRAAELFSLADLGKEVAQYDIYEYWAILRSTYGATANRSYYELLLNQAELHSNPSIVQLSYPQTNATSDNGVDQEIYIENIWKSSTVITSPDVLPTTTVPSLADVALPTAGYVNLDDVDLTLFDFDEGFSSLVLDDIGQATTIWVAKINPYDWNVYRAELLPGDITSVSDNLDGRALVQFSKPHGLSVGDVLVIKYFDTTINGVYRVRVVTDITSLLIDYVFTGFQTSITGNGIGFTLQTARVAQSADVIDLPYALQLTAGARVWVDNNGDGLWEVIEKTDPFGSPTELLPEVKYENTQFGASVSQGLSNLSALIGAPGYNPTGAGTAPGAVYTYVKTPDNVYDQNSILQLGTTGAAGYGNASDIGDQSWAIVGASASSSNRGYAAVIYRDPGSNVFEQAQLLAIPPGDSITATDRFGHSVTMSQDERWIYVGAPGGNIVYAYGRVDYQTQSTKLIAGASQNLFLYSDKIVIAADEQLVVAVGDQIQTFGTEYTVSDNYVVFPVPPLEGSLVTITRRAASSFVGDGSTTTFSLANVYSAVNEYAVVVYLDSAIQRPVIDYTVDGSQNLIFATAPASDVQIAVKAQTYYTLVDTLTVPGLSSTEQFGFSVSTTTDGRQVMVGTPTISVNGIADAGTVYVFDRSIQNFQVTDANVFNYTTVQSPVAPVSVLINGQFLTNTNGNIGGTFSVAGSTVTLVNTAISVGDIVTVETNNFALIQTVVSETPGNSDQFGYVVDQCVNDCSMYIGAPFADSELLQSGFVEFDINQARVYGTITSTVANPVLTVGNTLRIRNFFVELTGTTISDLVDDINAANVPNMQAALTTDVELLGDGTSTVFDVGSVYSAAESYTTRVLIDDVLQTAGVNYVYSSTDETVTFTTAPTYGSIITVVSGRIVLSLKNFAASTPYNRMQVLPGTGTAFADVGFDIYVHQQKIISPVPQSYANFGKKVFISDNTTSLLISAPNGTLIEFVTFDNQTTTFDAKTTIFSDGITQSGVVYLYDRLPSASPSVSNPAQFVFGQQIFDDSMASLDEFGAGIDYTTGTLLIGAPGNDQGDSTSNYGRAVWFRNDNQLPAWQVTRLQQPVVDINLLNTVYMYDRVSNKPKQYFDYFDPLQGRLLGVVAQNINYIGAIDPAAYNIGGLNNYGSTWTQERVGEIWWNTSNARFIDVNQDDIVYASRRWGQLFPGSTINVYQWVASSVAPTDYAGPGIPLYINSYVISSSLSQQGIFNTVYYFWVSGINTVDTAAKKTLSIETIRNYIESPRSSGISYVAPLNASTMAIYNGLEYISAQDTVLHVEYDQTLNDAAVHVEYQLIVQDRADGFLSPQLYNKLQDSFCGVDVTGASVPDPTAPISEQYGVASRPRQSMFVNRFLALKNYLTRVNNVLAQLPIAESRVFNLLNSEEPEPSSYSGAWNKRVANYEELTYQDLAAVNAGYLYLVASDATNNGLWTIYQVANGILPGQKVLELVRVQNYDTKRYWNYINWYQPGYNIATRIIVEVPNYSALDTITVPQGSSVKVTANAQGKWEIYQLTDAAVPTWTRVGLQDGTIEFSATLWDYALGRFGFDAEVFDAQYYDQEPVIETRKIIQAINEELLVGDLLIERNRALILMFNYIMSEEQAPTWLAKTSLIDVNHTIRELVPFQSYRKDNQDFVLNYIQEIKPYHVQIREFNLIYDGFDQYNGTVNDFDLPAYWDAAENLYISPVLDNAIPPVLSTTSSVPSTSEVWQTLPWNQWYQNYLLSVESVNLVDGGSGYQVPPDVLLNGEPTTALVSRVNSAGEVVAIDVVDTLDNFVTTPTITILGGLPEAVAWVGNIQVFSGTVFQTPDGLVYNVAASGFLNAVPPTATVSPVIDGTATLTYLGRRARAVAVMGNGLVRNIVTTIKYDRYEYQATIVDWQPDVSYDNGTQVRYIDRVWAANSDDSTAVLSPTFDPDQWTVVPASDLSGVDRTMGYYVPEVNEPGLDLALLITGVDYPGVQVSAPDFNQNTGFDVGNFDINPFDNLAYGPEGRPTYDPAILDAIYASEFTDPFLGTLPAPAYNGLPPTTGPNPIIVDGGAFVDTYSSHAPEELVPGAMFDTLDMRVFTTPGSDWDVNGHGFPVSSRRYVYAAATETYNWAGLLDYPTVVQVYNLTTGVQLTPDVDFVLDWPDQTATLSSGAAEGDTLVITAYSLGGGNQLYVESANGTDIVSNTLIVPVEYSLIEQLVIFVNGELITNYTFADYNTYNILITFSSSYTAADQLVITAMGTTAGGYSWSIPLTQYFVADGVNFAYTLTNSLEGTNPANIIVEKNGIRARPAEGVEYIDDGSSLQYYLPTRGGYSQALISDNDVSVYVNNEPLTLGVGFVVDPYDGSTDRTVTLTTSPPAGATILISVRTAAQYYISGNTLIWKTTGSLVPIAGDIVSVTTFNDTSEQNILTQVFQGPSTEGVLISQAYDDTDYDVGDVNNAPGSFDYSAGSVIQTNQFDTGRPIADSERIEVTLDGFYLFEGIGYNVEGSTVVISGPVINAAQVVSITNYTASVIPGAIAFRIFQDMRGLQSTYRITPSTTTQLTAALSATADVIYVADANALSEPNLPQGIFGLITIDGERIAYRTRDTVNNTVSGLRRGTAGTGAANHSAGAAVYDIGAGNRLPQEYQNYIVSENFLANGVETTFTAADISVATLDSTEQDEAVEVYVGGIRQTGGYTIQAADPVTIVFAVPPTKNYQVTILVKRGLSWYAPGSDTASNGIALQEQQTVAARFIRGG
jgi:hypothetical protein